MIKRAVAHVIAFTLLLGLAYPLAVVAIAGVIGGERPVLAHAVSSPRYFHPRPSATDYGIKPTAFANRGPNQRSARSFYERQIAAYLKRERPYTPGLKAVPMDAVTDSASGVDPDISPANARIQARRVAAVRHLPLARVDALIRANTHGGGVNVMTLNQELGR
jgi:K+-transporting ATPase ATPase C chain